MPYQLLKVSPVSCGGIAAGALDRGEVLREHDAALELAPARVAALREVDRAAGRPEALPVLARGLARLRRSPAGTPPRRRAGRRPRAASNAPVVRRWLEHEVVSRLLEEPAAGRPREPHLVAIAVEPTRERPRSRVAAGRASSRGPPGRVQSAAVVSPAAVGEAQPDRDLPARDERRDDAHGDASRRGWHERLDLDRLAVEPEAAAQRRRPTGRAPARRRVRSSRVAARPSAQPQPEADAAQVQPVRVPAQPLDLGRAPVAGDVRVADLAAVRVERP